MRWNHLSILKHQRFYHWSLEMDSWYHPTLYNGCNYLSMMTLNIMRASKRAWGVWLGATSGVKYIPIICPQMFFAFLFKIYWCRNERLQYLHSQRAADNAVLTKLSLYYLLIWLTHICKWCFIFHIRYQIRGIISRSERRQHISSICLIFYMDHIINIPTSFIVLQHRMYNMCIAYVSFCFIF